MKNSKPGIIRRFFIFRKLNRLTRGELALQKYLKTSMDELLTLQPAADTMELIDFLQRECVMTTSKIAELQEEKKKTYLKLI